MIVLTACLPHWHDSWCSWWLIVRAVDDSEVLRCLVGWVSMTSSKSHLECLLVLEMILTRVLIVSYCADNAGSTEAGSALLNAAMHRAWSKKCTNSWVGPIVERATLEMQITAAFNGETSSISRSLHMHLIYLSVSLKITSLSPNDKIGNWVRVPLPPKLSMK